MHDDTFLLELRDVRKSYRQGGAWSAGRRVTAVDGVSLAIRPGQCLALVGASGSGKSTLGRLALGVEAPDTGRVFFHGSPVNRLAGAAKRRARRAVQVVFQNSHGAVNPRFTARDIVGEPLANFDGLHGPVLERRVGELLQSVGVSPEDMHKRPHQFSGGELQRICIARALASDPELIVLDEAVSSLDMVNQGLVLDVLRRIQTGLNTAFLFISHDLRVVWHMADAVAVMDRGRVVEYSDRFKTTDGAGCGLNGIAFRTLAEAILPERPAG